MELLGVPSARLAGVARVKRLVKHRKVDMGHQCIRKFCWLGWPGGSGVARIADGKDEPFRL